jgi:ATP adenylyltransferase
MNAVEVSVVALEQSGKAHIRMLWEQRLQSFVHTRGIGIWDYRLLDEEPIPDSLRQLVLKAAGGRCQLCGITAKERPLDVHHTIALAAGRQNSQVFTGQHTNGISPQPCMLGERRKDE